MPTRWESWRRSSACPQKFDALGISVRDANGALRPTAEVLKEVADRFQTMPDGAEKTALAMDLFGKSGAAMIPMLNAGSEGMTALMEEARALGLVISQETADSAGKFNDNLNKLYGAASGLAAIIAAQLAPVLEQISNVIVQLAQGFQNLSPEWQSFIGWSAGLAVVLGPVLLGIAALVPIISLLLSPLALVIVAIGALTAAFIYWEEIVASVKGWLVDLIDGALTWFGEKLGISAENMDVFKQAAWDAMTRIGEAFTNLIPRVGELAVAMGQMAADAYNWVTTKFEELVVWLEALPSRMLEIGRNIAQGIADGIKEGWSAVTSAIQIGNEEAMLGFREDWQIQSPSQVTAQYGRHIAEGLAVGVQEGQSIVGQAVKGLNDTAQGAMQGIGNLGDRVGDMFATAATNVLTGVTSLREAVGQLLQQLAQLLINSAMKQLFGNIFSGGGGGGLGALFGGIPGYASGTMNAAAGWAMVGEAGPELVRMRGGERVFDAGQTGRMMGTGGGDAGQPVQVTSNVYLDGTLILSTLETFEGEQTIARVGRKVGAF